MSSQQEPRSRREGGMNTKAFVTLLVVALVLGASLGGAFAGGIVLGKSQRGEAAMNGPTSQPTGLSQQQSSQKGDASPGQLRQRFQAGNLTSEELAQLQQQAQQFRGGGFGVGTGQRGGGFGGARGGLTGTIEKIEGNKVTINTAQGPLQATIGAETAIQMLAQGTFADLIQGLRVTVVGQRGEDGTVTARSIFITPEGTDGFFGGGFFSGTNHDDE